MKFKQNESLEKDNDTGFLTEDLVKIYNTHTQGKWHPVSAEDDIAEIDALIAEDLTDTTEKAEEVQWSATDGEDYLAQLKAGKPSWL